MTHRDPRPSLPTLLVLVLASAFLPLAAGCGSSKKPTPGTACALNSDCNNPLSCTFGRCHTACQETRDCPAGQRCVKAAGGNVCQLAEEKSCPPSKACMDPLICAADLQCRNGCATAADCVKGQACLGGACVEPSEITPDGKLVGAGGTDGGATSPGDAARPTTDARDAVATAGDGAALGPCGVPEREPNDTRDTATPLSPTAELPSCLGTVTDVDFYEITAPSDPAGGYLQISFTGVGMVSLQVTAYNVSDNGLIDTAYADTAGQDLHLFFALASGQKYRLAVHAFAEVGRAPATYTMKSTYTRIADTFEPNDTRETAKPITLGMPIMAYLFAGHRTARIEPSETADWYSVMAAAGVLKIKVENVPTNLTGIVEVFGPDGRMVGQRLGGNNGANVEDEIRDLPAGLYRIGVASFALAPVSFGKTPRPAVPDNYTRAYRLTVSQ